MTVTTVGNSANKKTHSRVGMALAGGGPLGGVYEVGVLAALDEALDGVDLHDLHVYVGVSAGAFLSANLVNGFSTSDLARIYVSGGKPSEHVDRFVFMQPAWREYWRSLMSLPRATHNMIWDLILHPLDKGVLGALSNLTRAIPTGFFDNEPIHRFLSDLYSKGNCSNDFRKLKNKLFVVATDLDTGESVRFGAPGFDHIPVSKAVQASTAMPGYYPPVEIEGSHYVDGALKRTLHASVALDAGADLLLCINPVVPYDASLAHKDKRAKHQKLKNGGLPVVMSQTVRSLIHSRMNTGIKAYESTYPGSDLILFEPNREDSRMFFANLFSYSNRRRICEHAYQTTRRDLLQNFDALQAVFTRHNIRLRREVLTDTRRHFDTHLNIGNDRWHHESASDVTRSLSDTLDRLDKQVG